MVVSITTDAEENSYLIFESLNYKGEPLTQADLIRNYFFMRLASEDTERQEEIYRTLWLPMQQKLGEEMLGEFIRHYLSKDGRLINRNAYTERAETASRRGGRAGDPRGAEDLVEIRGVLLSLGSTSARVKPPNSTPTRTAAALGGF